jgi:glycosyltransferase involved in cell wall biosynthesis
MKIAVIGTKGLPAKQGGVEHYCQELYPRMVERGHTVDLFARSTYVNSGWLKQYCFRGVKVISLPGLNLRGLDAAFSSLLGAILASNNQYDIIHFHALGPSLFTWLPKMATSAKIVVSCQGLDWQRAKWGKFSSQILYMGEKTGVRFADRIIVVSEALRSYFRETYGVETVYIPNAPASYPKTKPDFAYGSSLGLSQGRYIVFLGRLVPEKRPELLIQAFQTLKATGWKLVLVGGTSDTDSYTQQIVNLTDNDPNVVLTGEIYGNSLAQIVRSAGLFVLPSDLEGLPLAMLEAMHEGVPVLASDIPPHQQLIAQERGILFQAGSIDSCARALDWAMHHPQELKTMAQEARKYVDTHHNWEEITTETLRNYQLLLNSSENFVNLTPTVNQTIQNSAE